jgi:hypothetical protein
MSCDRYVEQFTDFLEGALPAEQWRELEEHLQQCPECAAEIKDYRRTVSAVRGLALVQPSADLPRRILIQLEPVTVPVAQTVRVRPVRRGWTWQAVAAALTAVLLVAALALYGLSVGRFSPEDGYHPATTQSPKPGPPTTSPGPSAGLTTGGTTSPTAPSAGALGVPPVLPAPPATGPVTTSETHSAVQAPAGRVSPAPQIRLRVTVPPAVPHAPITRPAPAPQPQAKAAPQTHRQFRSVTLAAAAAAVAADCGLGVEVDAALAAKRVTANFSSGASGPTALAALAFMAGAKLQGSAGNYRLVPAE